MTTPIVWILGAFVLLWVSMASSALADTIYQTFVIQETPHQLCNATKNILTVNGSFPGPTLYAHNGDVIYVNVINNGNKNISIHWHGINQPRDPWSDGPEYITQCPIQPGANYTQRVNITEEEGTLWWHAHSELDRTTVHGAIVVYPKRNTTYPFTTPDEEFILILGEWWHQNVTDLYDVVESGTDPAASDASIINGLPGTNRTACMHLPFNLTNDPCSASGTFTVQVEQGKIYLLRVINSAMANEYFFAVANHTVTVVGTDGSYTKPYANEYIMITPGQTFDLLLEANQFPNSSAAPYQYYIAAQPFFDGNSPPVPVDFNQTVAILQYKTDNVSTNATSAPPICPFILPQTNDSSAAATFTAGLRALASSDHPVNVPQSIDEHMYITVSVNFVCPPGATCIGPDFVNFSDPLGASLNNASFQSASVDILDAYYRSISGVYTPDFPDQPPFLFNFTGIAANQFNESYTTRSTKVKVLEYNTSVEIVFQGTNLLGGENHPMHLHGHSFYVVGRGMGNFNNNTDPSSYNLIDPPYENTVGVPKNGWAAIRFWARNPGVWFMHCHFDRHTIWGMDTVFITKNGNGTDAEMLHPPSDRPPC